MPPPSRSPSPGTGNPTLADDEALRLFSEPNAFRWAEKWRAQDVNKRSIGWNFPAFFFAPFWLMYRKLWAWGAGALAFFVVLTIFSVHAEATNSVGVALLCALLGLGMSIFFALRADDIYRQYATRRAAEINREGHDRQRVSDKLQIVGGVSWPAALGTIVGWIIAVSIIVAVNARPAVIEGGGGNDSAQADNMDSAAIAENVTNDTTTGSSGASTTSATSQLCSDGKNREITVTNSTGKVVYSLRAYSPSTTTWSDDLLGSATLAEGASAKLTVANRTCACDYELRAYSSSNTDAYLDYPSFNVCSGSTFNMGASTSGTTDSSTSKM